MPNKNKDTPTINQNIIKKEDPASPISIIKKTEKLNSDWISKEFKPLNNKKLKSPNDPNSDNTDDKVWSDVYGYYDTLVNYTV